MDLREVGYDDRDWINLAQDRDRWRAYLVIAGEREQGSQGRKSARERFATETVSDSTSETTAENRGSIPTSMVLPPPSKEVLQHVRQEFGLDEQGVKQGVQVIREWLEHQPHLPNDSDDARLERWIIRCKNSLERTKQSLDMYYTLKTVVPDMLMNRDPQADWFKRSINLG
ncbi:hypothetical protein ANN_26385 [Periplaneta americana]|uniref:Uncharacterized protein n=1 Tax=Periplaneta americana TaxID=6978 RepID=A0ABQ8RY81_PERAM|nr:hypothetical protein ANN_26385 [Periplaneta americana]